MASIFWVKAAFLFWAVCLLAAVASVMPIYSIGEIWLGSDFTVRDGDCILVSGTAPPCNAGFNRNRDDFDGWYKHHRDYVCGSI